MTILELTDGQREAVADNLRFGRLTLVRYLKSGRATVEKSEWAHGQIVHFDAVLAALGEPPVLPREPRAEKVREPKPPRVKVEDLVRAYLSEHGTGTVKDVAQAVHRSTDSVRDALHAIALVSQHGAHGRHYWKLPR